MKLFFDENLSPAQAQIAREGGHNVVSALEAGLSGKTDAEIRRCAIAEGRILVTLDADFANIYRFPPQETPGVIRLRVHPPTESAISNLLRWSLPRMETMSLQGKLAVVEPERIRVR